MTLFRNDDDHLSTRRTVPKLLVSVRSSTEAIEALTGGADIVDVKEPDRGSLGMADPRVISEIAELLRVAVTTKPLSVALGELTDWKDSAEVPQLPAEVTFAKLGLSDMRDDDSWYSFWRQTREQFDQRRAVPLRWVAVAYADFEIARAPSIDDVARAAIESQCAGLLIDTFAKTSRTLSDLVTTAELRRVASQCHAAGLFLAIAGRLKAEDLGPLSNAHADIIAIRSAACEHHDRKGTISARKITEFRAAMHRVQDHNDRCLQTLPSST